MRAVLSIASILVVISTASVWVTGFCARGDERHADERGEHE